MFCDGICIAEFFTDRTDVQCLHRWQKVLNPDLVKGAWTKSEDDRILELVTKHGATKWSMIAQHLPGRIGKQCRERQALATLRSLDITLAIKYVIDALGGFEVILVPHLHY
jgi:hypothetical protein